MSPAELRETRVALGLTQEALARELGVTGATVYRWEAGTIGIARPEWLAVMLEAVRKGKNDDSD